MKKINLKNIMGALAGVFVFSFLLIPVFVSAQSAIIPCDGTSGNECNFNDFILLIDNVIGYLIAYLIFPICVIASIFSGFLFLTAGDNASTRTRAIGVFKKVIIGLVIVMTAWLVVNTFLIGFNLKDGYSLLG